MTRRIFKIFVALVLFFLKNILPLFPSSLKETNRNVSEGKKLPKLFNDIRNICGQGSKPFPFHQ